jgi:predicted transposase YbfD/YdcC
LEQELAHLVREHWSTEAHHHIRDTTFSEDTSASWTGSVPANPATISIKDGYGHSRNTPEPACRYGASQ